MKVLEKIQKSIKVGIVALLILLVFLSLFLYKEFSNSQTEISSLRKKADTYKFLMISENWADIDGDGSREYVPAYSKNSSFTDQFDFTPYIAAYDDSGTEIARTSEGIIMDDSTASFTYPAIQPDVSSKKEIVRFRSVAGPHTLNDTFIGLVNGKLMPICKAPDKTGSENCTFFNSSYLEDIIQDFDKDGLVEVIEIDDEYPATGGRGRPVLSGVYKYNNGYFKPQEDESYKKIFDILNKRLKGNLLSKYQ